VASHLTTGLGTHVAAAFESAVASAGGVIERRYRIGGHVLLVRGAGSEVLAGLDDALGHLIETGTAAAELTVLAWDASNGIPFPAEPTSTAVPVWKRRPWFLEFDAVDELSGEPPWRRVSGLMDASTAVYWASDPSALPAFARGTPLLSVVHRWLSRDGLRVVHGAAVATPAGAALIVGDNGAGKSTTALACRGSGLSFLGDDYVAVELEPLRVHSLYRSAKLSWDHPASVGSGLQPVNSGRPSDEKALFFLRDRVVTVAPIRAIVAPRVVAGSPSGITAISEGRALAALAPSTVLQLPGNSGRLLADLRRLCTQVPAFELRLGSDVEAVGALIEEALTS
jgi:hypothetical protein